jgi:glycosyltransferase involved in cell wall biosynthesis
MREIKRKELNIQNKFVVCYCGAMSHWQCPAAIAKAFSIIRNSMPDAHFLIISREADQLLENLRKLDIPESSITAVSSPHDKVASFLSAGDCALLLREDTLTNRVASPVKFAEYIRCGLSVILTPYIGDFGAFVQEKGIGQIVTFPLKDKEVVKAAMNIRSRLEREGNEYRKYCSEIASKYLSWDGQLDVLMDMYQKIIKNG